MSSKPPLDVRKKLLFTGVATGLDERWPGRQPLVTFGHDAIEEHLQRPIEIGLRRRPAVGDGLLRFLHNCLKSDGKLQGAPAGLPAVGGLQGTADVRPPVDLGHATRQAPTPEESIAPAKKV
jgi:hypothetical protein